MYGTIKIQEGLLAGTINRSGKSLSGIIKVKKNLIGHALIPVGIENYTGEYTVRPKVEEQVMSTRDKRMTKDVTIEAIPYYEVSNQNGKTIIIGGN